MSRSIVVSLVLLVSAVAPGHASVPMIPTETVSGVMSYRIDDGALHLTFDSKAIRLESGLTRCFSAKDKPRRFRQDKTSLLVIRCFKRGDIAWVTYRVSHKYGEISIQRGQHKAKFQEPSKMVTFNPPDVYWFILAYPSRVVSVKYPGYPTKKYWIGMSGGRLGNQAIASECAAKPCAKVSTLGPISIVRDSKGRIHELTVSTKNVGGVLVDGYILASSSNVLSYSKHFKRCYRRRAANVALDCDGLKVTRSADGKHWRISIMIPRDYEKYYQ